MNRLMSSNVRATLQSAATTRVVSAGLSGKRALPMVDMHADDHHHDDGHMALPNRSASASLTPRVPLAVANSFTKSVQVRHSHTDIKVPDFSDYRNDITMNPNQNSKASDDDKKTMSYISTFSVGLATAYTAKAIVQDIVANVAPSQDVLAMAKIEVNLNEIPEGKNVTMKWRSKPLFIKHRTAEEIAREQGVDVSSLRDPQSDDQRVKKAEWLVLLGICTHLGCVPLPNAGDYGGYFCPCHGSHYDNSGRIRKGPAPLNLEVPPYDFNDDLLIVG